jgi:hypothetical protein
LGLALAGGWTKRIRAPAREQNAAMPPIRKISNDSTIS